MTSGKVISAGSNPETATRFDELVAAFVRLRDPEVVSAFLRDLCTSTELDAMGQRLQVARLVDEGVPYQEISRRTGASTATEPSTDAGPAVEGTAARTVLVAARSEWRLTPGAGRAGPPGPLPQRRH
jgi:TrpR-related protein YerC/YecD